MTSGSIFVKAGTYTLTTNILINAKSNIKICGEGDSSIIQVADGAEITAMLIQSSSNIEILDLLIDGNKANNIDVVAVAQMGINMQGVSYSSITDVTVQNCVETGINGYIGSNNTIFNCRTTGNGESSTTDFGSGIDLDSMSGSKIIGCFSANNQIHGIWATGTAYTTRDYTITGNTVLNNDNATNTSVGIMINTASGLVEYSTVSGNTVGNNYIGIEVYNANGITVSGNTIHNSTSSGIALLSTTYSTISGNTLNHNGNYWGGIELASNDDYNLISTNTIYNSNAYGIVIANANCDQNILSNNNIFTSVTSDINDSGTNTIIHRPTDTTSDTISVNTYQGTVTATTYQPSYTYTSFNLANYSNVVGVYFTTVFDQQAEGSYTCYAQLYYQNGTAVAGSEISASVARYGKSEVTSGNLLSALPSGTILVTQQIKVESGGTTATMNSRIIIVVR